MNYNLPYFGQIDLANLKDYYSTAIGTPQKKLSLDLNFENKTIDQGKVDSIKYMLDNIDSLDKQNRSFMEKEFTAGEGETIDHINFYLEELDEEELSRILGDNVDETTVARMLLNKLQLVRIGFYPDNKDDAEYFSVFDYSIYIDGEPSNQLLVVVTKERGDLNHITWES